MVMPRVLSCIRRACEYLLFPGGKVAEAFSAGFGFAGTIQWRRTWVVDCELWSLAPRVWNCSVAVGGDAGHSSAENATIKVMEPAC
jgi:hypothetical protein